MSVSHSIDLRKSRTGFRRQQSEPEYQKPKFEPIKRSASKTSLLTGKAILPHGDSIYRFLSKDMFNVLFSLAKDTSAAGSPISSPASSSRDGLITTVYKLHRTRARILEPYRRLKNALKGMQDAYSESKERNIFVRYSNMNQMIHEVVLLEKQYWQLINIPGQEVSENQNLYVLRVMNMLDERGPAYPVVKTGGIASLLGATLNMAEKTKDQNTYELIRSKSTDQLRRECDLLYMEVYKLIRKYLNLRAVVQELTERYQSSRFYPIIPRYLLLKTLIKQVLRSSAFSEVCHEASE